jgi:hypothetical protein
MKIVKKAKIKIFNGCYRTREWVPSQPMRSATARQRERLRTQEQAGRAGEVIFFSWSGNGKSLETAACICETLNHYKHVFS